MKGLLRRASTAFIFCLIMLGGLYGGRYSFLLLFAVITAICLWEFFNMVMSKDKRRDKIRLFLGMSFGFTPFVLASLLQLKVIQMDEQFIVATSLLFFPFIFFAFIYELFAASETPFSNVAFIVLGMMYIGAPFALLDFIAFEDDKFYANVIFGLLLITWSNDTGAYVVGSKIGKTKLIPRISPNKTWEGTIGGVVVTFIVSFLLSFFFTEIRLVDWIVLAGIVAVFGSIGDLVESMLKRRVGVKDSGNILPGHGGLLDRFDGFIFLLPFAAAYLLWIR